MRNVVQNALHFCVLAFIKGVDHGGLPRLNRIIQNLDCVRVFPIVDERVDVGVQGLVNAVGNGGHGVLESLEGGTVRMLRKSAVGERVVGRERWRGLSMELNVLGYDSEATLQGVE